MVAKTTKSTTTTTTTKPVAATKPVAKTVTTPTTTTTTKAAVTKPAIVAKPTVVDNTPKVNLINKEKAIEAINAVIKYSEVKKNSQPLNILGDDNENVFVSFETDKYYHTVEFKPYHITLPNEIYELSSRRTLVIIHGTKEEAMDLKTTISEMGYTGLFDVLSMKQFKKEYITPELKIKVRKQYEEFIVDSKYKQKIQNIFGKEFYLSSQSPKKVQVDLKNPIKILETLKSLNKMVLIRSFKKLLFTIPVGNFELGINKLIENIAVVVNEITNKLPEKIKSIQSLAIAASDIRLPFYVNVEVPKELEFDSKKQEVVLPKELLEKLAAEAAMNGDFDDEDFDSDDFENFEDDDDEEEEEEEVKPVVNNKKRSTPEPKEIKQVVEEKQSTPNKKVKQTPVKEVKPATPVKEVKSTPAKEVKPTPAKETKPAPAKKEVKESTPVKQTPVKQTPVKQTPVKQTPVKQTPIKKTPAKK